jgi:hypothetical protein
MRIWGLVARLIAAMRRRCSPCSLLCAELGKRDAAMARSLTARPVPTVPVDVSDYSDVHSRSACIQQVAALRRAPFSLLDAGDASDWTRSGKRARV